MTIPTAPPETVTAYEHHLERELEHRHLECEGYVIWREEQERPRREKEELWAAIAELQSRLAEVELRLDDLDACLHEASE